MDVREKTESDKRLIDANALISYMDDCSKESRFRVYYGYARSFIDNAPTIDAVPVVRCRECKYSRINHLMKKDILSCENIDVCGEEYLFERNPNDFCSYGERKEGAD